MVDSHCRFISIYLPIYFHVYSICLFLSFLLATDLLISLQVEGKKLPTSARAGKRSSSSAAAAVGNSTTQQPQQQQQQQPEVSTTLSVDLASGSSGVYGGLSAEVRAGSLDSIGEGLNGGGAPGSLGLSTVPNQFCTGAEALELRKILMLARGNKGGLVPSTTAVMDMYMVGKVVGVGSYGKVRAAWHRLVSEKVAIKTYDKSKLKDPAHWKRVHSEIKITELVSHPRIARTYEAVETPKRMHLIMECLEGGNLCSYVKAKKRLSEHESRHIFFQLMQAVEYLHSLHVTHRDIKLENVLFDSTDNKDIKLIDFGFSTISSPGERLKVFCGTPSYMAPEIVKRSEYEGRPVDMWSMGILLYALLCGCFPFRAKSYPDLYRRIARGQFVIPEDLSPAVQDLIRQLLCVDATRRVTSRQALGHPWLQAELVAAPDMSKLRRSTTILISDNARDDLDEETLQEIERFGVERQEVVEQVLRKSHTAISTLYYLLLSTVVARRRRHGSRATELSATTASSSSGSSGSRRSRPSSASATSRSHRYHAGAGGGSDGLKAKMNAGAGAVGAQDAPHITGKPTSNNDFWEKQRAQREAAAAAAANNAHSSSSAHRYERPKSASATRRTNDYARATTYA
jgi:serine/threonine protein kinase